MSPANGPVMFTAADALAAGAELLRLRPCVTLGHDKRRLDWDRERKGWPTRCKTCAAEGFTTDPTVPRLGAV